MMHPENHNPARSAVEFNPYVPGHDVNPYPVYEKLRAESPVAWWAQSRAWLVSRYDDIIAVLRDTKQFTSDRNEWELAKVAGTAVQIPELAELNRQSLLSVGNQDHVRLRKLISPALTPRAIERLRPDIQAIVEEILDSVQAKGTVNVVTDIADHIPARVVGSMLRMPKGREALFQRFTEAVVKTFIPALVRPEDLEGLRADIREGMVLIRETIEDRRRNPLENDILTTLIQTEEQGDKLNTQELLSLVSGLIVGGFETTIHLIGFSVFHLLTQPGLLAQVKAEPELMKGLIDEVLRFDHFGKMGIARYALEDVELGGQQLKKGQMLLLILGSGLRDESAFDKAEVFDVRRTTNASIAFGHGAHYCIGASLARLEVQIAVGTLIQRFPEMTLTQAPAFGPHPVIRRMETLQLRLRPE